MSYVTIKSDIRTTVYKDVSSIDRSQKLAELADKHAKAIIIGDNSALLRNTPTWHNIKCAITVGTQAIPRDVLEWVSFQTLVKKNLVSLIDEKATKQVLEGKPEAAKPTKPNKKTAEDLLKSYDSVEEGKE